MIFLDSNVPMYLVGSDHPHKLDAQRALQLAIADRERLVTDAEVLQEILHRYHAIRRPDAIEPAFRAILGLADEVFPVEGPDVGRAKDLLLRTDGLSSRDALHLAVMRRRGVNRVLSYDAGFDGLPDITRLH